MGSVLYDLRVAVRGLIKARGFSIIAVVTLGVAIGAVTAIFSVVDGVLLRPLPYPEADRIVRVAALVRPQVGGGEAPFSDRGYWFFVHQNHVYSAFGGYEGGSVQVPLTGDGPPLQVDVGVMTTSAFKVLGTSPLRGRLPSDEEGAPGGPQVALLSYHLWLDRYGADPAVIGKSIDLNGASREVIGVMPPRYDFPAPSTDVWVPDPLDPASTNFGGHHIQGIARLAPGKTVQSAVSDAEGLIARFGEVGYGPSWFTGVFTGKASVKTLKDTIVGDARRPLWILLGTVAFVLLIACSNVANLLLVRAEGRTRETGVRLALGSSRLRLAQYVLLESVVLALAGGALGVLLAWLLTQVLVAMAPASIPRLDDIGIRGSVLAFSAGVAIFSGLLFGVLPALKAGSKRGYAALRDGGRGTTIGRDRHHARALLVVGQVALALVLLVGSGLMVRSFQRLRDVDPGFRAKGVMTFRVSPPPNKYPDAEATARFYDQLIARLQAIPGVTSAGGINTLPLTGGGAILTTIIDEFPPSAGEFPPTFLIRRATPGYFKAMGIPVVEGRAFEPDDHHLRLGSLIISKSIKQRYWPRTSALGKRITTAGAPARTVGVVGDVHDGSLDKPADQIIYKPLLDSVGGGVRALTMTVRTSRDPASLTTEIRKTVTELDPDLPITELRSMDDVVGDSLNRTTFTMSLLVLAALIALFLGSVGIYGVLSYVAAQRVPEIGVRLALGADRMKIRAMVLREGILLAAAGIAIGVAGAEVLGRFLGSLLFQVSPSDPVVLAGGSLVFLVVALVASVVPAERAARTPPAVALRGE